jgi:hypothetical protein
MQSKDFHITIGSHPVDELSLENDMRLVKASLLYADKAKLCNFTSSMLLTILSYGLLNTKQRTDFVESLLPIVVQSQENSSQILFALEVLKSLKRKKNLNKQELLLKMQYTSQMRKTTKSIEENFSGMLENAGIQSLLTAIESGLLEIHPLNIANDEDKEKPIKEFVEVLSQAVSDENTYPLFDDQIGDLMRLAVKEGEIQVSQSGIARGKHSALAANLIERLPLFDEAEINEVLDIRQELSRPLKRFRSAMIKFSEGIKNASWDEEFSYDVEVVFIREIEPAILDIEDAIKSNNYLANLTRKIISNPLTLPAGSALGVLMSPLSELPMLITTSLGVGTSASIVAYDAYKEWKQNNLKTEQNNLFFYYKAKENLSNLK